MAEKRILQKVSDTFIILIFVVWFVFSMRFALNGNEFWRCDFSRFSLSANVNIIALTLYFTGLPLFVAISGVAGFVYKNKKMFFAPLFYIMPHIGLLIYSFMTLFKNQPKNLTLVFTVASFWLIFVYWKNLLKEKSIKLVSIFLILFLFLLHYTSYANVLFR